jgi:hypothetical protein
MKSKLWLISLSLLVVTGCLGPRMVQHATDLHTAGSKIVVIGKFELWPPVVPELEQNTRWNVIGDERILNTLIMATGPTDTPVDSSFNGSGWQASIESQWGRPFMVELERQTTWLKGGMMQLDVMQQDRLWFPGGLYFDIPAGAKAVYIGTLRYTRNDFNTIVNMEVLDDQDATLTKLGVNGRDVVKSLLKTKQQPKPDGFLALNHYH